MDAWCLSTFWLRIKFRVLGLGLGFWVLGLIGFGIRVSGGVWGLAVQGLHGWVWSLH